MTIINQLNDQSLNRYYIKVDVSSDESTVSSNQVDLCIVTKKELSRLKEQKEISQREKLKFEINCKAFLSRTAEKLLEKWPFKFPVVRHRRCLNPQVIAGHTESSVKLFERLLGCLFDPRRVREPDADILKEQYLSFVTKIVLGNAATLLLFQ